MWVFQISARKARIGITEDSSNVTIGSTQSIRAYPVLMTRPADPDLKSFAEKPDAVFMLTSLRVIEAIVQQCVDLGIKPVWMHCMRGTKPGLSTGSTSVSSSAVEKCKDNPITVIPGSIPGRRSWSQADAQVVDYVWLFECERRNVMKLEISSNHRANGQRQMRLLFTHSTLHNAACWLHIFSITSLNGDLQLMHAIYMGEELMLFIALDITIKD